MHIESVMPSNHLILCYPFVLSSSIFSTIRVFSNESVLYIRWPKYWSFNFNISPSNEHSGLISFRMDLLGLLDVQETLKSLFQHHSSKASILLYDTTFTSIHDYQKNHSCDQMDLDQVGHSFSSMKQASFNFMATVTSAVILEPKKIKSVTVSLFPHVFAMK